jgi:tRNA nucleotidyltransferase (CCA-adding enzyme)
MVIKINEILKKVLIKINPSREEMNSINEYLKKFMSQFEKQLKKTKISAEVFVGGSFAKKTLIKKGQYDIDVFVRFDERYKKQDISKLTEKALDKIKTRAIKIHGSRDYFKINVSPIFFIEIIPVLKVKNPKQAENITDLSYFHVNYIRKKLKTEKMIEDVRLAKAFCHANKCYGAESYINGFSGYAIELLIYHYKSFLNFIRAIERIKGKEIIDIEKFYKNKYEVVMNMNTAKMASPIVLIDPTYKERNALAALSQETFLKFQDACRNFLKAPSLNSFEIKKIDLGKIKKNAEKNKAEFILIKAETEKQEGDVAGSKLVKFYKHLSEEVEKFYKISNKGFDYPGKKETEFFFVVKRRTEIIRQGPNIRDFENVGIFKKHHKDTFVKQGKIYARDRFNQGIREFIENWKIENSKKMNEMHIKNLEIIRF